MKVLANTLTQAAASITFLIGTTSLDSFSLKGLGFLFWAVSPYFLMIFTLSKSSNQLMIRGISVCSMVIALFGTALLVYSMYIQKDAQSALAFVVIPIYQWGIFLLSSLFLYLIYKIKTRK